MTISSSIRIVILLVCMSFSSVVYSQDSEAPPLPAGLESPAQEQTRSDDGPPLPAGLGDSTSKPSEPDSPPLPSGLGESSDADGPALPEGLGADPIESSTDESVEISTSGLFSEGQLLGFPIHGFWDTRFGMRTQDDPAISDDLSIGESRLQLETEKAFHDFVFQVSSDFYYDGVIDNWETDLRTVNVFYSPLDFMDVRVGRQILTWGTGDMIFINDLFPKDWQSFFIGRDVEYLKAPSDALRTNVYTDLVNIDFVYVPQFDSDRYISGERLSYWSDSLGSRAGELNPVAVNDPDEWFHDDEFAFRLHRMISSHELAVYGYDGYWKSPGGMNPANGFAIFPELSAYGASLRGNVLQGIGNIEIGYYHSKDDPHGDDPFIKNSEFRFLLGYEQEIAKDFTAALQYYLEYMMDYDNYRQTLPAGIRARDEDRHVITLRLTKLLLEQDLTLSLFAYLSPSDKDTYLRAKASYKVTDRWLTEIGSNIFLGDDNHTFFGQFERNTNVYAGVRYSF